MSNEKINYWLFQTNPKVFRLREALAAEAIQTFSIKAHKKKIKAGDKIILWQAGKQTGCYGLATVESNPTIQEVIQEEAAYFQKIPKEGLRVKLAIDYNLWNKPITKEILPNKPEFEPFYAGIPGTNFKATKSQFKALVHVIERLEAVEEPAAIYLPIRKPLSYLNLILQGPPGTGKTYQTVNHALSIIEDRSLKELAIESRLALRNRFEQYQEEGAIQFITFHQSYSYEDFVEGIKPNAVDGNITYGIEDGIFKRICQAAQTAFETHVESKEIAALTAIPEDILKKSPKFVMIIDEINRGNIASIFGELITLLEADKRIGMPEAMQSILPYSKKPFGIPPNLHIIGTMNTSGRNTTNIDAALRRRFEFKQMPPRPALLQHPTEAGVDLAKLLTIINQRITLLLGEDYCIGHAYFMSVRTLDDLCNLFDNNIIPLLSSYFFNDWQKVAMIIGPQFFGQTPPPDYSLLATINNPVFEPINTKAYHQLTPKEDWREEDFILIYEAGYKQ